MLSITYILIIITSTVSLIAMRQTAMQNRLIFNPYRVKTRREYWRFLSSGFIHKDLLHLLFNMIALYFFGAVIETVFGYHFKELGIVYYLLLYFGGVVVSDIPSFFRHHNNPYYNSLGASGGVSAVLFGAILYRPTSSICIYFAICLPAFILGILYLLYSFYFGKKIGDNVNHDAHFYGAIYGALFTILLRPEVLHSFYQKIIESMPF
ncbi:MAG: rhomboid family intramembrane serine protease [Cyclobacteriaceae bacterium]